VLRLDEQVARCFQRLQAKEFEPLVEYLRESRKGTLEQLVGSVQTEQIFRLQGEAGILADLLSHIKNSSELLTKLSATRKG
jgi:hypothetical protein